MREDIRSGRAPALLFDLDGVLTPTSALHRRAWAAMFGPVLERLGADEYTDADYFEHVDGRPRLDGIRAVLAARGQALPDGGPGDEPGALTVYALGEQKNDAFNRILEEEGIAAFPGSAKLLAELSQVPGVKMAVVSSSKNAAPILELAGIADYFDVVVDGSVAAREGLPGKPSPATFLRAAELLGVAPDQAVVFEDAVSGVKAGRDGGFGHVVGVDRGAGADELLAAGADVVVADLGELTAGAEGA